MESIEKIVAKQLLDIKAVKLNPENPFTWASGWKSPIYCDNRKVLSYPAARKVVYEAFVEIIKKQFKDVDVIAGVATGAAMCGARPVAEIMHVDFIGCCFDIVLNQMSKMCYKTNGQVNVPLVIRTQCGRGRSNGCTQSQSLESLLTHIPGLKVVMPSTPYDAKGLLKSAIRDNDPVIFIEHKGLYQTRGEIPEEEYVLPIGKADIKQEGTDVTIITYSKSVLMALDAAKELGNKGFLRRNFCEIIHGCSVDNGTVKVTCKDLEGLNLFGVLLKNLCGSNCIRLADCDCGHTDKVLLHFTEANLITSSACKRILHNHVLNACFTKSLTHLCVVINGNTLVIYKNTCSGSLKLLCELCNDLLLLSKNRIAGHLIHLPMKFGK